MNNALFRDEPGGSGFCTLIGTKINCVSTAGEEVGWGAGRGPVAGLGAWSVGQVAAHYVTDAQGWHPAQPGLIDDLDKGHYFHHPSA